jgi:hypothetical protein
MFNRKNNNKKRRSSYLGEMKVVLKMNRLRDLKMLRNLKEIKMVTLVGKSRIVAVDGLV